MLISGAGCLLLLFLVLVSVVERWLVVLDWCWYWVVSLVSVETR